MSMRDWIKWTLIPLAFVPILVDEQTLFPFIFPKTFLIRTVVALFWTLLAVWFFLDKRRVRELVRERMRFLRNPVFLFTLGFFVVLMALSTVFAVDSYRAFFGDVERGEGLLGTLNFIGFFVAFLLIFDKKDWITFFRGTLAVGAILFIDALDEFLGGLARAQSFLGNPTFLAAVFLFVIFAALVVLFSKPTVFWKIASVVVGIAGFVGVFLTGTRGAILGLLFGGVLVVTYFAVKGRGVLIPIPGVGKKVDLRRVSLGIIMVGVLSISGFIVTRDNPAWQSVPGLGRFAGVSFTDSTLQTRIISAGVSMKAVNPQNGGILRMLVGYGPDNFNIAYNKYYNPEYMRYEPLWFDRAHDKVFDVLVMNGVLGLIAYMGIWVSLLYVVFRRVREKAYAAAILFFGGAYFVQNLFVFDQISTYIPFLSMFAFAIFVGSGEEKADERENKSRAEGILSTYFPYASIGLAGFFIVTLVLYVFVPYRQGRIFIDGLQSGDGIVLLELSEDYLKPYNYVQEMIRARYLRTVAQVVGNPQLADVFDSALAAHEEYVTKEPYDPRDILLLANVYGSRASLGYEGAFETAEKYYLDALELAPARQEHLYSIALLYASVGDFDNMQKYMDIMMEQSSSVPRTRIFYGLVITQEGETRFAEAAEVMNSALIEEGVYFSAGELGNLRNVYQRYIAYQFSIRDRENFRNALEGALYVERFVEKAEQGVLAPSLASGLSPAEPEKYEEILAAFDKGGFNGVDLQLTSN